MEPHIFVGRDPLIGRDTHFRHLVADAHRQQLVRAERFDDQDARGLEALVAAFVDATDLP